MSVRRMVAMVAVAGWVFVAGVPAVAAPAPTPSPSLSPQSAPAGRFVEINPSTVEAGYIVGIRASCTDADDNPAADEVPATVDSDAFGQVEVRPQYGFLTGTATVPADTEARSYRVYLDCPGFLAAGADTDVYVVNGNRPERGPDTGFGGMAGGGNGTVTFGAIALGAGVVLGLHTLRRRRAA